MTEAYMMLFNIVLVVLGLLFCVCMIRLIVGPDVADRIIATNMMSTLIVAVICVLAYMKHEGYLMDVAIIYTLLSFLGVVLLTKIYLGIWKDHRAEKKNGEADRNV